MQPERGKFATVVRAGFAQGLSSAGDDADWQDAKPYLEPLNALVAGTSGSGDDLRSAFKLVVK